MKRCCPYPVSKGERSHGPDFGLIDVRNRLNQPVASGSFLTDVNADGQINILDLIATRNNLNLSVTGPCVPVE